MWHVRHIPPTKEETGFSKASIDLPVTVSHLCFLASAPDAAGQLVREMHKGAGPLDFFPQQKQKSNYWTPSGFMGHPSKPSCETCQDSRRDARSKQAAGATQILVILHFKLLQYRYILGFQELVTHLQELNVETAAISFQASQGHCVLKPRFNLQFCMRMTMHRNIYETLQWIKRPITIFLVVSETGVC